MPFLYILVFFSALAAAGGIMAVSSNEYDEYYTDYGFYEGCKQMIRYAQRKVRNDYGRTRPYRTRSGGTTLESCADFCLSLSKCAAARFQSKSCYLYTAGTVRARTGLTFAAESTFMEKKCRSKSTLNCNADNLSGILVLPQEITNGSVYVKGHYTNSKCRKKFKVSNSRDVNVTFNYFDCGADRYKDTYWNKTIVAVSPPPSRKAAIFHATCPVSFSGSSRQFLVREPQVRDADVIYEEDSNTAVTVDNVAIDVSFDQTNHSARSDEESARIFVTVTANGGDLDVSPVNCSLAYISPENSSRITLKRKLSGRDGCPLEKEQMTRFAKQINGTKIAAVSSVLVPKIAEDIRQVTVSCDVVTCRECPPANVTTTDCGGL